MCVCVCVCVCCSLRFVVVCGVGLLRAAVLAAFAVGVPYASPSASYLSSLSSSVCSLFGTAAVAGIRCQTHTGSGIVYAGRAVFFSVGSRVVEARTCLGGSGTLVWPRPAGGRIGLRGCVDLEGDLEGRSLETAEITNLQLGMRNLIKNVKSYVQCAC